MQEFQDKFVEEATGLLIEMEQKLLELEKSPEDQAVIEDIFRAMHTLKGTAGMYGFKEVGNLMHRMENVFDSLRSNKRRTNKEILDLALHAVDLVNKDLAGMDPEGRANAYKWLHDQIDTLLASPGKDDEKWSDIQEGTGQQGGSMQTWFIRIRPVQDLRSRGVRLHVIFQELEEAGKVFILERQQATENDPLLFWEVFLATTLTKADIEDILLFILDITEIHLLDQGNVFTDAKLKEQLDALAEVPETDWDTLVEMVERRKQSLASGQGEIAQGVEAQERIKVAADMLDEQMTLLSELVITKAEFQLMVSQHGYKPLAKPVEQLEEITRRFRKNIYKMRLVPLEKMQLRFDRLVRDLSEKLGKEVDFVAQGMHTTLDKAIVDSLESPIMHLLRNALDHGLETPEKRVERGKSRVGSILLSARQKGGNVVISIRDDGEGIDSKKIKQKAVAKGIISKDSKLSERELQDLIFLPGFSSAGNLTEVSGRGVGMDVVRHTINNLRGRVEVETQTGEGTTFHIHLPLTFSIIDTMLVRAGQMFYAIPISAIDKCTEIESAYLQEFDNRHLVIDDELMPYAIVHKILKVNGNSANDENNAREKWKVVVVRNEHEKNALLVDEVIGEHQAVLKALGSYFAGQQYIAGATQLADGHIALVLDPSRLFEKHALHEEYEI